MPPNVRRWINVLIPWILALDKDISGDTPQTSQGVKVENRMCFNPIHRDTRIRGRDTCTGRGASAGCANPSIHPFFSPLPVQDGQDVVKVRRQHS